MDLSKQELLKLEVDEYKRMQKKGKKKVAAKKLKKKK